MLTEEQIQFLNLACPGKWTETNGVINVNGRVDINYMHTNQIPVQFGQTESFECQGNNLTTLKGCPSIINGHFNCNHNQLTNLEGGPKEVGGYYLCNRNQLTTLEGSARLIIGEFHCNYNPNLKYLWGIGRVKNYVDYANYNEINEWIIECMQKDTIFPFSTLKENIHWIKQEQKYSCLLEAPEEIRQYFSPRILHLVDMGTYHNQS